MCGGVQIGGRGGRVNPDLFGQISLPLRKFVRIGADRCFNLKYPPPWKDLNAYIHWDATQGSLIQRVCCHKLWHNTYIFNPVHLSTLLTLPATHSYPATFTIYKDTIVTENWNIPYVYGYINLRTLKPHRKNPVIANVFSQMGIVEELGSGTVKMFKYTPLYSDGKEPVIEEQDVYRIEIPYIATLQAAKSENGLKITPTQIIEILRITPTASYEDVARQLGKARSTVAKHMGNLQKAGIIRRGGPDKGGYWEVIE